MRTTLFAILLFASARPASAASSYLFQNIQAGQSMLVVFTLAVPPPSPYNLLGITAGGSGFVSFETFSTKIFDGALLLGSATSASLDPLSLRLASNPFLTYAGASTQIADLSSFNDDGTLQGRLLITPNFSSPAGSIAQYGVSLEMMDQTSESGGSIFPDSQIEITSAQVIPEPQSLILAGVSLALLMTHSRRRPAPKGGGNANGNSPR